MNSKDGTELQLKDKISLEELSFLTGFPIQFIKDELSFTDDKEISVEELRARMLIYLDKEMLLNDGLN